MPRRTTDSAGQERSAQQTSAAPQPPISSTQAAVEPQAEKKAKKKYAYSKKRNGKNATGALAIPYLDQYAATAQQIAALGAMTAEIGRALGVSESTVEKWMREHKDFKSAIEIGRDAYDSRRIKGALRDRALGYHWEEKSVETTELDCEKVAKQPDGTYATVRDEKGRKVMVRVPATKTKIRGMHVPSDPACIFFWLTNRDRSKWQHVRVNKVEGKLDVDHKEKNSYNFDEIGKDELALLRDSLNKAIVQREASGRPARSNGNGKVEVEQQATTAQRGNA